MPPLTDQGALVAGVATTAAGLLVWAIDKIVGALLEQRAIDHLRRKRDSRRPPIEAIDSSEVETLKLQIQITTIVAHEALKQRDAYREALVLERKQRERLDTHTEEIAEELTDVKPDQPPPNAARREL
ncbi:hypothetical protein [Phenylobacterium sp.]|uniref:hypothetical protein n=1 Tax=Phenylobacterium sp. TaxID=1871053 RepID=UPI0035B2E814